ncbi:S8 family serine peptidase [Arthrobacter sp. NPDC089319]|uniref:S8 family serine peptidase n=1 Tax=Arthrobacter sp. NPDC089319 TaxID=3155915 RepID=UPI0034286305
MTKQSSSFVHRQGMRSAAALALGIPLILSGLAGPAAAAPANIPATITSNPDGQQAIYEDGRYIVMLDSAPLATYEGGVAGIEATKPAKGEKLNSGSAHAKKYRAHLTNKQGDVAASEGVKIQKSFTTAVNGFVAELTGLQAAELAKKPGVVAVAPDEQHHPDYSSTDYLDLPGRDGVWAEQYGGTKNAGKGTVVGVIDTGYYPESDFLAGEEVKPLRGKAKVGEPYLTADGKIAMLKADGSTFLGECQPGQEGSGFDGTECNSKVLSARYYADDFLRTVPAQNRNPKESISPLDIASHGTHTATTAAGNSEVTQTVAGRDFGTGNGVAPAAKVSVYKTCWEDNDEATGGCYTSASVDAIEQAILDGVDVLNYSISGNNNSVLDPVSVAFLSAAEVGIFVSASAGNAGPGPTTVNHSAPWVTTVAASTFSNELQGTVELSDGTKYRGTSIMNREVPQTSLILSAEASAAGATADEAKLCYPGKLDPAKVEGKIVVCDRGVNARADKSVAVKQAGGVGMVLVNVVPGSLDLDLHAVPTVHIADPSIKDKVAADPTLTAALRNKDTTGLAQSPVPQIAAFSSRGPSTAVDSNLLKPDVAAPGVNVLAGVSPVLGGETNGFMSGTSMAAPHVAGLGALLLAENPRWSPATVKSAMMTTAGELVNEDGSANEDRFATGAGHVDTARMGDPGLVYDANVEDWLGFIQGTGLDLGLKKKDVIQSKDLNVPSFALGKLSGEVTVERTLTALEPGSYTVDVDLPGVAVKVSPRKLNFTKSGQERKFKVTFQNVNAPLDEFAMGELVWTEEGKRGNGKGSGRSQHTVASPIAVRPVTAVAPASVAFTSDAGNGTGSFKVTSGTNSPIDLAVEGLAKAKAADVEKVPGQPAVIGSNGSTGFAPQEVPEGATLAQFAIYAADAGADWDLHVLTPAGAVISAATASASESLVINNPVPGTYYAIAHLFSSPDAKASKGTINTVALSGDSGNLTVSPDPLNLRNGKTSTVKAAWSGLEAGNWVGLVRFSEGISTPVTVNVSGDGTAAQAPAAEGSAVVVEGGASAQPGQRSGL